jgi:hypothetical protein
MSHSQSDLRRLNGGFRLSGSVSNACVGGLRRALAYVRQCFAVCSSLDKTSCTSESAAASPFAKSAVT